MNPVERTNHFHDQDLLDYDYRIDIKQKEEFRQIAKDVLKTSNVFPMFFYGYREGPMTDRGDIEIMASEFMFGLIGKKVAAIKCGVHVEGGDKNSQHRERFLSENDLLKLISNQVDLSSVDVSNPRIVLIFLLGPTYSSSDAEDRLGEEGYYYLNVSNGGLAGINFKNAHKIFVDLVKKINDKYQTSEKKADITFVLSCCGIGDKSIQYTKIDKGGKLCSQIDPFWT